MNVEKAEKLRENREKVENIVSKYINRNAKRNTGQLKFLNGLLARNVAVTIGITLKKDKRFQDYLNDNFLKDKEELLSYFDPQKNTEAFVKSPYYDIEEAYKGFSPDGPTPLYLLLRKAQTVMDRECLSYLQLPGENWETEEELKPEAAHKKKEAYVKWLFSIALYEIFLIEYGRMLPKEPLMNIGADDEDMQLMSEFYTEIFHCTDREKKRQQIEALYESMDRGYAKWRSRWLTTFYIDCFFTHVINLYGMLRLIAMIEFVRIGISIGEKHTEQKNTDKTAEAEAVTWRKLMDNYGDYNLFTIIDLNPNLTAYAGKFRETYQKYQITPHAEEEKKVQDFKNENYEGLDEVSKYINMIKNRKAGKYSQKEELEKIFSKICIPFATPILNAVNDIARLK